MALQIAYWATIGVFSGATAAQVPAGLVASESVDVSDESTQSELWPQGATIAEVFAEEDCFVSVGDDPDASSVRFAMAAGTHRYIGLAAGGAQRFAVIERVV